MPGGNPVASTPGMTHSKSFRSRLGFGGGSGIPSTKPSFFSLKTGRKSFGGTIEFGGHEGPVLVIDPEPEYDRVQQENRVVLNEETERTPPSQSSFNSTSPPKDLPFQLPKNIISHSLPPSPTRSGRHTTTRFQSSPTNSVRTQLDPDESGLSKHFPDLSTDLSLLMNEPAPNMESQSDLNESKPYSFDTHRPTIVPSRGREGETQPALKFSPAGLDNGQSRRLHADDPSPIGKTRPVVSSPPARPEESESATSGFTNGAVENASASFDLSSAKLSLDFIRQSLGDDWTRSLGVEVEGVPSAETSALIEPPASPLVESGSGPVTSTPFLSPRASHARPQEAEISFNLDALDPDLVALLRPNQFNPGPSQGKRVVTPSPLEPFAPPPDPLNPDTTLRRPVVQQTSLSASSSSHTHGQKGGVALPPARKYATLATSTSPVRALQLPRSNQAQEFVSHSPVDNHPEVQRSRTHSRSDERPSPSVVASSSGTPSESSKHPSPLSAVPLTLGDLERRREPSPAQTSVASTSTQNIDNVTARRKARTRVPSQTHPPRPGSALTSSTDSRPAPRYSLQERDRELRQASASPSPSSPGPSTFAFGSLGREHDRSRPSLDGLFPSRFSPERSAGRPNSASGWRSHNIPNAGPTPNGAFPNARERDLDSAEERRYRKRSMSLDQSSSGGRSNGRAENPMRPGGANSTRFRRLADRDRVAEWEGSEGSEFGYGAVGGLDAPFDGRYRDRERDQERYGYGYGDRERHPRSHTDWLGPRTAKAFAAAGLLEEPRESSGLRYGAFGRSASERDFRSSVVGNGRERERWSPLNGGVAVDGERDRPHSRFNFTSSIRSGGDRDYSPGIRAGAETPSTASVTRPPSRGEPLSHTRAAPLFARTMSDLMSQRGSADGRENGSATHHRPGSVYSPGGAGESAGSGGGRASPTTTSSLAALQSQMQTLKDKHDAQTEALLGALADSQKTARELKEENEALKSQVRMLEERLVETIANSRQREKELVRTMKTRPRSPERAHVVRSHRDPDYPPPPAPLRSKAPARLTPSPIKRRLSTSSSIFPTVPASMTLLMAETPGSPPQGSLTSDSRPPSPTLVLSKLSNTRKPTERREWDDEINTTPLVVPQPIPISHKRSTSGASMATSANFSFDTGSPGSLKLKPEHELLLGDMTRLSLITGFDGDSEVEG